MASVQLRPRCLFLCALFILLTNTVILLWFGFNTINTSHRQTLVLERVVADFDSEEVSSVPVLLWWTPFTGDTGSLLRCGGGGDHQDRSCFVTTNRSYFGDSRLGAAMFYGSDFAVWDLPLPRRRSSNSAGQGPSPGALGTGQPLLWALLHEESPKNAPIFCHLPTISQFNLTATFSRYSDVPLTLQHVVSLDWLTGANQPPTPLRSEGLQHPLAPIIYIASSCDNPSHRDHFVLELSRYIGIDSYGVCLNNRTMPVWASEQDSTELASLIVNYRFYLAVENARCDDYITEKLWLPLSLGVVPLYWGAGNIREWLPCARAAVLVDEFDSPRHLAEYLHKLLDNDDAYQSHLCHRQQQHHQQDEVLLGVTNDQLLRALSSRTWSVQDRGGERLPSFIDAFECAVCDAVWSTGGGRSGGDGGDNISASGDDRARLPYGGYIGDLVSAGGDDGGPVLVGGSTSSAYGGVPRIADQRHYGCARPVTVIDDASTTWWTQQWERARAEADVLADVVADGVPVSRDEFSTCVTRKWSSSRKAVVTLARDEL